MKLSVYAKKKGITYHEAWMLFTSGKIQGSKDGKNRVDIPESELEKKISGKTNSNPVYESELKELSDRYTSLDIVVRILIEDVINKGGSFNDKAKEILNRLGYF